MACDELPPMALAAGTFFGTAADGGSKVTTGFFPTQRNLYLDFFWGGSLFEIYGSRSYFGVADTMVELHFPSVYEKKKYDGIEKLSDRQTFQISKASRNA